MLCFLAVDFFVLFFTLCFLVLSSGNIIKDIIYLFIQRRGASVDLQGILPGPSGFQGKWGLARNGEGFKAEGDIRLLIYYLIKVLLCRRVRLCYSVCHFIVFVFSCGFFCHRCCCFEVLLGWESSCMHVLVFTKINKTIWPQTGVRC